MIIRHPRLTAEERRAKLWDAGRLALYASHRAKLSVSGRAVSDAKFLLAVCPKNWRALLKRAERIGSRVYRPLRWVHEGPHTWRIVTPDGSVLESVEEDLGVSPWAETNDSCLYRETMACMILKEALDGGA